MVSDNEFIKGKIILTLKPQSQEGFYEVKKGNDIRKYTFKKYFDLDLQNWESYIDSLSLKSEKLGAVNKAIFNLKKDLFDETFPIIKQLINKNIAHLEAIEKYINFYDWIRDKAGTRQQTETKISDIQNKFDKVNINDVYNHFKVGLVDKQYLTEQELIQFLKAAFELKKEPETLFKIKDAPNKAAIEAVFYRYYKNVAGKIHGKQNQYAALLGNYFEGYKTTTVSSNFSKSVY